MGRHLFDPEDETWIMSEPSELREDAKRTLRYLNEWNVSGKRRSRRKEPSHDVVEASSFPGATESSIEEKVAWVSRLDEARTDEYKNYIGCTRDRIATTEDIAGAIFHEACPEEVGLVVQVSRKEVEELNLDGPSAAYGEGIVRFGLSGFTERYRGQGEDKFTWTVYRRWLLETQKTDMVTLAVVEQSKDYDLGRVMKDFIDAMSFMRYCRHYKVSYVDKIEEALGMFSLWDEQDLIGKNLYFKTPQNIQEEIPDCKVCIEVILELKNPEKKLNNLELKLDETVRQSRQEGPLDSKDYHLIPNSRTEEVSDAGDDTEKNYQVFWYSDFYHNEDHPRVKKHLASGYRESIHIKHRLQCGNTDAGNCKVSIFEQELTHLKKVGIGWAGKFTCALALTTALIDDAERYGWFGQNEFLKDVELLMKELSAYWRLTLLKRTDEELGINPPSNEDGNDVGDEGGNSPSRTALYALLDHLSKRVEREGTEYCRPKFDWRAKKRKPVGALANDAAGSGASSKKAKNSTSILRDATEEFTAASTDYENFTQSAASKLNRIIARNRVLTEVGAKKRCWQIRCTSTSHTNGTECIRILLLTGATPMHGLTKIVAEAYNWRPDGTRYVTATTKGVIPPGSFWTVEITKDGDTVAAGLIGAQKVVYEAVGQGAPFFDMKKIKLCNVLCERGDRMVYRCDNDRRVDVVVQGVASSEYKYWTTPRIVGAAPAGHPYCLPSDTWSCINSRLLGSKQEKETLLCSSSLSEEERRESFHNHFKYPLLDDEEVIFCDRELYDLKEMHRIVVEDKVVS